MNSFIAVLLCTLGSQLVAGKTLLVAVASNIEICDFPCEKPTVYFLERASKERVMDFSCMDRHLQIYGTYRQRLQLNQSTGCCTITNAQKYDSGKYVLEYQELMKVVQFKYTTYLIIHPVSVTNINATRSDLGKTVALSVSYNGEEATVQWTWNGGALPERHQLSDSNKTLTVPSTDTGTFTVLVSNPVSLTSAHYNLTLPDAEFPSRSHAGRYGIIIAAAVLSFAFGILMCYKTAAQEGQKVQKIHTAWLKKKTQKFH
ncbi:uncharacterized protein LOC108700601 isoform X2 [Xenopus laevis]|uniref:Uncharacterized protein LOC108700601 isoform X2 n=1 Tax=Xenopus laevis TaxID=8355 RepID=A0A8J1LNW4_XENLA|nr:uncharacterized protein LOC108700601 isoform X2 [Xenopus laevis]